jgi:hypothetical protein
LEYYKIIEMDKIKDIIAIFEKKIKKWWHAT